MPQRLRAVSSPLKRRPIALAAASLLSGLLLARCGQSTGPKDKASPVILTVGVGQAAVVSDTSGLRQLKQILSGEGLINLSEDGRPRPALAESWTVSPDRLALTIRLRSKAQFHDGSRVNASAVATILKQTLPAFMGRAFEDVVEIGVASDDDIRITLRRPAPLLIEALESQVRKPDGSATGPFKSIDPAKPELVANEQYYLGRPAIGKIAVQLYPSIRTAWAEMLRNHIDMLYEVGPDALESLTGATDVSVFTFVRHYQLLLIFNGNLPVFRDASVRRAFNLAVNREEIIREGLNGHGVASRGLVWPNYWAFPSDKAALDFDSGAAATALMPRKIRFVCLVPPAYERVALVLKRQLEAVGVEMILNETATENLDQAFIKGDFQTILTEFISGPSFFRVYRAWHSQGPLRGNVGNTHLDTALDRVRFSKSDDKYRAAVREVEEVTTQDPPAVFLAWSQRARAVNRRFDVQVEPGRDILTTLRLWRPTSELHYVDRN